MAKALAVAAIWLMGPADASAQTTLYSESFETDGEGTRYTSNTYTDCALSDYFFRTNTNPVTPPSCSATFGTTLLGLQGSYFWASEDIRSSSPVVGARSPGNITTQIIDISGYSSLQVSLYLATSNNSGTRWESSDSLNIKASINGGAQILVGRFMGKGDALVGNRLGIDSNLDGVYNGSDVATNCDIETFTKYTFSIPGSGCNLQVIFDFDQLGGTEELAIDLIEVTGTSGGGGPNISTSGTLSAFSSCSGAASAPQSFNVSGTSLTGNLVVTAPTGFEVSTTSGSGYGSSLSLTPSSGTVSSTQVFVRLAASASGSPSGQVACTSQCATTRNVAASGTVNSTPSTPTITPGGPTTFCSGGSITLSSSAGSGNQWRLNGGDIGGATGTTYAATASGTYTVVSTVSGCSSAASSGTVVTVNPTPSTPSATPGGPTTFCTGGSVILISSAATGNQWYLDGNPLSGVTAQFYAAGADGDYTVIATASGCSSAASSAQPVTVNPSPAVTADPVGSSICAYNSGSYSVTATDATGYQWQESTDGGGSFGNITDGGVYSGTGTSLLTITQPPFSMSGYQYRCVVSGGCAPNATSAAATMTVIGPQFTQQPTDESVCENSDATFSVTVSSPGFPSYQWFYSTDNGLNFDPVPSAAPYSGEFTSELTITGATVGMDGYLYRAKLGNGLCAILSPPSNSGELSVDPATTWYADPDGNGYGDPNSITTACTQPLGYSASPCGAPTGLSSSNVLDTRATVQWTAGTGATNSQVRYRPLGGGAWGIVSQSMPDVDRNLNGLSPSTTYVWEARSRCSTDAGDTSVFVIGAQFTTAASCGTATGLASSNVTDETAKLTWTAVPSAAEYKVRYRVQGSGTWTTRTVAAPTVQRNLTGLSDATTYEYMIGTTCTAGTYSESSVGTFTTLSACPAITGVSVSNITATTVRVNWATEPDAASYTVRYGVEGSGTWSATTANAPALLRNISGLAPSTTYEYYVRTNCTNGLSELGELRTFTTASARYASPDANDAFSFRIYPNPTQGEFRIEPLTEFDGAADVRLTDMTGRTLLSRTWAVAEEGAIELGTGLAKGTYILTIAADGQVWNERVVVTE